MVRGGSLLADNDAGCCMQEQKKMMNELHGRCECDV